jgi:hypothetical protein
VFGADEGDCEIEGFWKDRFIGDEQTSVEGVTLASSGVAAPAEYDGLPVTSVEELTRRVDTMRRQGQPVEVTWATQRRVGFITRFSQSWENEHDCRWKLSFEWLRQDEAPPAGVYVVAQDTSSFAQRIVSQADEVAEEVVLPFPSALGVATVLDGIAQALSFAAVAASEAAEVVASGSTSPEDASRRQIAVATGVVDACALAVVTLGARAPETLVFAPSGPSTVSAGVRLLSVVKVSRIERQVRVTQRTAAAQRWIAQQQIQGTILGTWTAKQGDDLRDVSRFYYGTPDEWRRILVFNRFAVPELAIGQLVVIPRLIQASQAQGNRS